MIHSRSGGDMSDRWNLIDMLRVNDSEIKYGVKIEFNTGELSDYVDPVMDSGLDESETTYYFYNGYGYYGYKKSEVKNLIRYELCQECLASIDKCRCKDKEDA